MCIQPAAPSLDDFGGGQKTPPKLGAACEVPLSFTFHMSILFNQQMAPPTSMLHKCRSLGGYDVSFFKMMFMFFPSR